MRTKYVITNFNSVYGLEDNLEEANKIDEVNKKYGTEIVRVLFDFSEKFEKWYNDAIYDVGDDIYMTDGDCLLAGIYDEDENGNCKQDIVIGTDYLIQNLEWCIETDESNMNYLKKHIGLDEDNINNYNGYKNHKNAVKKMLKVIRNWDE